MQKFCAFISASLYKNAHRHNGNGTSAKRHHQAGTPTASCSLLGQPASAFYIARAYCTHTNSLGDGRLSRMQDAVMLLENVHHPVTELQFACRGVSCIYMLVLMAWQAVQIHHVWHTMHESSCDAYLQYTYVC